MTTLGVPASSKTKSAGREATVLDIFAGAGGLSQGLMQGSTASGSEPRFRTVQAVELDAAAAATYRLNHSGTRVFEGPIEAWLDAGDVPQVDIIIGGPPCQGFSTLGKQDVEDDRNELWWQYVRTITMAQPKYFVVENVAAFMKSPQYALFEEATAPGGAIEGYDFQACVLNAADYGAFQARKRAVLIGHRRDLPFPGWPEKTHVGHHRTVREAFAGIPSEWDAIALPEKTYSAGDRDFPGPFRTTQLHLGRDYSLLSLKRFALIPPGGNRFSIKDLDLLAPCWRKHTSGSADVMGRLHWDRPAVTIRTEFFKPEKGRYLHPEADRAITHMEAAILQGFPRAYQWVGSKTSIARQIGNAVPIQLGAAIGRVILDALDGQSEA